MTFAPLSADAAPAQPAPPYQVLGPETFAPLVASFSEGDDEAFVTSIPNRDALGWLSANVPRFDCPDALLTRTYYFRWWMFRKHLRKTPDGWIVTEFLHDVPWAGKHNSIACAAGHHLYEARWLRDPSYAADYAHFWFRGGGDPRYYSFWAADAVHAVTLATGDTRLEQDLLPDLVANSAGWEASHRDANGLFRQGDDFDGMEYSLGGSGYRPTINSYQYGDAQAIAAIALGAGQPEVAQKYREKASRIKALVQQRLWNARSHFFETAPAVSGDAPIKTVGVREEIGFVPWQFGLPDAGAGYEAAWAQLTDPQGFAAPFGPTTAERRALGFMHPEDHDCLWNGPSWPYATTQTLLALANLLNDYSQTVVSRKDYLALLLGYARSQQRDGKPWVAEDLDADTGQWIVDLPRSIYYNHSGFGDPVITGLVGLRPRADARVVVSPLVPEGAWDFFCLDGVPYHGHSLSVVWDRTGRHYGLGAGLSLLADGRLLAHRSELGHLEGTLPAVTTHPPAPWVKYAGSPVLGGELGTCFDIAVLHDADRYKMYFSWRPKQCLALSESADGIGWSAPQIVLGPAPTGWEDEVNRPCVLKRPDGYHLWYTGQVWHAQQADGRYNGRSEIGYAASPDGVHWTRRAEPVLRPDAPWEKVAVMCPDVHWDEAARQYRMYYSGGEQYEPDAIGYATSPDGVAWTKRPAPIFEADAGHPWEQHKVTACQVVQKAGWYYLFYVGFQDIDHAAIGLARSRDGVTDWQRLPDNPIVRPTPGSWDADACYKPYALYDGHQWLLWYNGRREHTEQIGLVTKQGPDLGFS